MIALSKRVSTFRDQYPWLGPLLWISSIQQFIAMLVVAATWPTHYSFFNNTISDLGNTACSSYGGHYVCSPLHAWMNASFIVLGVTMAAGSALIYHEFKPRKLRALGFTLMAASGVGTSLVGLFPENTISSLHILGATLPFVFGNISLIVLGLWLEMPRSLRFYTILSGAVALTAAILFVTHHYLGIGIGGMEHLTANLQTIWLIVFGIYISKRPHWLKY